MLRKNKESYDFEKEIDQSYEEEQLRKVNIQYKTSLSKAEFREDIKVILSYIAIVMVWYMVDYIYANFGRRWISVAITAMWVMGGITAFYIKEERIKNIKSTKLTITGYLLFLLMYRIAIGILSGVSADEMAVALNITIPTVSGQAATGLMQNILLIASVMTPIGYLIFCAQKFRNYKAGQSKEDAYRKIKDIRNE